MRLLMSTLLVAGFACGDDSATPGLRGECSALSGAGLECESPPIESPADACAKLLDCGAIPLENPPDQPECCFDWARCIAELEGLDDFNREQVFACVEISSCDELKTDSSPDSPGRGEPSLPLCLQHGNQ